MVFRFPSASSTLICWRRLGLSRIHTHRQVSAISQQGPDQLLSQRINRVRSAWGQFFHFVWIGDGQQKGVVVREQITRTFAGALSGRRRDTIHHLLSFGSSFVAGSPPCWKSANQKTTEKDKMRARCWPEVIIPSRFLRCPESCLVALSCLVVLPGGILFERCPYISISMVVLDVLHVCDLGVTQVILGGCMWHCLEHLYPGRNRHRGNCDSGLFAGKRWQKRFW